MVRFKHASTFFAQDGDRRSEVDDIHKIEKTNNWDQTTTKKDDKGHDKLDKDEQIQKEKI